MHKIKIKVIPSRTQKWFTISGPEEWQAVDWDQVAIETVPNYPMRFRLQSLFADLLNDYKAQQRRREAGQRMTGIKGRKATDRGTWPIYEGLPFEIMADERTSKGEHFLYARPRSGQEGGGKQKIGWRCTCNEGGKCLKP